MHSDRAPLSLKIAAGLGLAFLHLPILLIFLYAFTTEEKSYQFPPPGLTLPRHDAVIQRMIEGAEQVIEEAPDGIRFDAIGVAVPGVIDMLRGRSIFLPNLPGDWPNVAVTPPIQEALGKPAYLINDVRAFTLAELTLGSRSGAGSGSLRVARDQGGEP